MIYELGVTISPLSAEGMYTSFDKTRLNNVSAVAVYEGDPRHDYRKHFRSVAINKGIDV